MPRNTIVAIWIAGIVLTVLVYATGPDRFVLATYDLFIRAWWGLQHALLNLSVAAFDLVRAAAVGLWGVFAALSVLSISRGGRGRAALVALSVVFFGLIWGSGDGFGAHTRWLAALALAAMGALSMTRRLTGPPTPVPQPQDAAPPRPGP
jgi:hypothetical protein